MCGGIEAAGCYTESGKPMRVYFPTPKAAMPVLQTDGSVEWLPGRRKEQERASAGDRLGAGRLDQRGQVV